MVVMVVAFCLCLAVLLGMIDPQRSFMRDINWLGRQFGSAIACAFLAPIRREQAWTAEIDALAPESLAPKMGDFTSWRYTPFCGVSATGPGCRMTAPAIRHREIDSMLRLMGRFPR